MTTLVVMVVAVLLSSILYTAAKMLEDDKHFRRKR